MDMNRITAVVLAAAALPLAACHGADCVGVGRPAFEVTVLDARTGASIADSAVVYVYRVPELARVDSSTRQVVPGRIWAATDQSGPLRVVVERPGYLAWTSEDRTVKGGCSVQTIFITARLVKLNIATPAP